MTIFDELQNGQSFMEENPAQALFAKDPHEALSVCRKCLETLPSKASVDALWQTKRETARKGFSRLLEGIEATMGRIPRSQGFFTSAADRKQAFLANCSFLELFQKETHLLDRESLGLEEVGSLLRHRELGILRIEARVLELKKQFKRCADQERGAETEALLERLSRERAADATLLRDLKTAEGAMSDFLTRTSREFLRFSAAKADAEHDGAGASPAELSRLLWGLRQELEALLKVI